MRREDDYPKLCVIRHLLIYIHCYEIDMLPGVECTPLFPSESKKGEFMKEKTLCRVLKRISDEVLNLPKGVMFSQLGVMVIEPLLYLIHQIEVLIPLRGIHVTH